MSIYQLGAAFGAGVLSFFTPCVFPLLPGYISLISEVSVSEVTNNGQAARKAGIAALFFTAGFAVIFSAMGATASFIGGFLFDHVRPIQIIAGIALVFFGLQAMGIFKLKILQHEARFSPSKIKPGPAGAFLMGIAFAVGWSPCLGPILGGLIAMASTQQTALKGCMLLFVYSLGLGLPFIIAGFAVAKLFTLMAKYRKFVRYTEIVAGLLLVVIGAVLIIDIKPDFLRRMMP